MKNSLLLSTCLIYIMTHSQNRTILVYDMFHKTLDSITDIEYDSTLSNQRTTHNIGNFNSSIELLADTPPSSNTYPGSQFTFKKIASKEFDVSNYPIRTSVKLFEVNNSNLYPLCSGSFISRRHVLTAAHCVSIVNTDQIRMMDSLYVSPIFDNGEHNTNFCTSYVRRIYFIKNWHFGGEDMAVLELEKPVGESTGWLGLGFDNIDSSLSDGIFYKFSYPNLTNPIIDSNEYNGDSLYYNYGVVHNLTDFSIRINNASGIGGESGSSIIKIENGQSYTTYGTLSLSTNLSHSRINNWRYFAIKSIIKDDITIDESSEDNDILIYPNPANDMVHIRRLTPFEVKEIRIYDSTGKLCMQQKQMNECMDLDISKLTKGCYYLTLITPQTNITKKVIKYDDQ